MFWMLTYVRRISAMLMIHVLGVSLWVSMNDYGHNYEHLILAECNFNLICSYIFLFKWTFSWYNHGHALPVAA